MPTKLWSSSPRKKCRHIPILFYHYFIGLYYSTIYITLPWAMSLAISSRVGLLLTIGRPQVARIAAYIGVLQGLLVVCIAAGTVYAFGAEAGYLFTDSDDIVNRMQ